MELKQIQCHVGKFNLLGNEQQLSFTLAIVENGDSRQAIEVDGIKAMLYFYGDPEEFDTFNDAFDNLGEIFTKCFEYGDKIWSSTDYKAQCLLFAKIYQENYEEINSNLVARHKKNVQKRIEELQKQLEWNEIVPDLAYDVNRAINHKISKVKKIREMYENELISYKEESQKYEDTFKKVEGLNQQILKLESSLVKEYEYDTK